MMQSNQKFTSLLALALICAAVLAPMTMAKKVGKSLSGEDVFKQNCASCHAGGGNIVTPHKPVAESSKLSTIAVFKAYLKSPVGHMPYNKFVVTDQQTLKKLYEYCKSLKPPKQV